MTRQQASPEQLERAREYARRSLRNLLGKDPDPQTVERIAGRALEAIPVQRWRGFGKPVTGGALFLRRTYKKPLAERAAEFAKTAAYWVYQLRLDFADLILSGLAKERISQKELADRLGRGESYVSKYINAKSNCNFGVVLRILWCLRIKPKLVDADEWDRLKTLERQQVSRTTERAVRTDTNGIQIRG